MTTHVIPAAGEVVFRGLDELRLLNDDEMDLVRIAVAVASADRRARRSSLDWRREVHAEILVSRSQRWREFRREIERCLNWLTGDTWHLQFKNAQRDAAQAQAQGSFWGPGGDGPVVCFSGGVDSFAAASRTVKLHGSVRLLSADTSTHGAALTQAVAARLPRPAHHVRVPFRAEAGGHAEPSYRTRTFCFFLLAAVAANAAGIRSVVVGENGQGILGPSVVTRYGEYPHYGAHPVLARHVKNLIKRVLGVDVLFDFPFLWSTKGEVVQAVVANGLRDALPVTSSCPNNPSRQGRSGAPSACGACAGCLLRRIAFRANGFDDAPSEAFWHDLDAPTLAQSCGADFRTTDNETTNARGAVLLLDQLARAADGAPINHVAAGIALPLGLDVTETMASITDLLLRHAAEWNAFLGHLSRSSWIRTTLRECREQA